MDTLWTMPCYGKYWFVKIRGHQTTARGPNPAREAISSGPRRHFANEEKQYNKGKFVDLAETFPETIHFVRCPALGLLSNS